MLVRVRTLLTLFFVPIFALGSKYQSRCTLCGKGLAVSDEYAVRFMVTAAMQNYEAAPAEVPVTASVGSPHAHPSERA
jgi:hypothetical protein